MIDHKTRSFFIHIPKTGGMTLRKYIYNLNASDKWMHLKLCNYPDWKKYWKSYFTFVFVRNPWDRLVSAYQFTMEKEKEADLFNQYIKDHYKNFNDFILNVNKQKLLSTMRFEPQVNWIQNYTFDFIGRFENLQQDYEFICDKLNKPKQQLTKINASHRKKAHYTQYYTEETKKIVEEIYKEDIERFNYKFGE